MNRFYISLLICLLLLTVAIPARAQNPFISKSSPPTISPASGPSHPFLVRIAVWQQRLNQKMATLARQTKETGSLRPLMSLIIIAFVYGILHAAGPGHGKAVAFSYLLARGKNLSGGLLFGNLVAFSHGMSGIALVLILHFMLQRGVAGPLESVTHMAQLISYSLIALLGIIILAKSLYLLRRQSQRKKIESACYSRGRQGRSLAMAVIVGLIPCPGVVLIMLFFLSLNMIGLGLLLAFSQILGMAVTISAVVMVGLIGKNLAFGMLERGKRLSELIEHGIEAAAGLAVTTLGIILLIAII